MVETNGQFFRNLVEDSLHLNCCHSSIGSEGCQGIGRKGLANTFNCPAVPKSSLFPTAVEFRLCGMQPWSLGRFIWCFEPG